MSAEEPPEQQYSSSVGVDENGDVVYHHSGGVQMFGQEPQLIRMEDGRIVQMVEHEPGQEVQYEEVVKTVVISIQFSATVDWQGDRTIPPGTITPIPCDEFPCPTGFYCSEGQEQCFVPGDCIVTPTECVPDGQTRPSEGSTTPPGTATDCVSHPCPDGFVCSDGEVVCSGYDDCTTGPPQCTPVDTDATAGPGTTPSTSCSTYTCNPDEVCTMAVGTPKCIPANMTCGENEEVNPCGDLCDLLCADLTGIVGALWSN
ncbi:hypothetical protein Y032_0008g175 [Ancylostoma ceylanicum]|uniref:Uncharacterized protein n=1 Tax=Ancylostoma ceylanicum TaxID=53326 RepID=A0A016VL69_9BILA|nr:hypothetical protein Y032_0008g175 [Ancylostoma ceylanicum]